MESLIKKITSYDGKSVNLRADVSNFFVKIIMVILIGHHLSDYDELLNKTKRFDELSQEILNPLAGVILDTFPWPASLF